MTAIRFRTAGPLRPRLSGTPFGTSSFGWGRLPRTAPSTTPNLNPPAPVWFLAILGLYVLLPGPVNYLLPRRLDRRAWAWVSLPPTGIVPPGRSDWSAGPVPC